MTILIADATGVLERSGMRKPLAGSDPLRARTLGFAVRPGARPDLRAGRARVGRRG